MGHTVLEREQLAACVDETHSDENIAAAEPYPGAVETVRRWHAAGHWIHITSHRRQAARVATELWLDHIGLPYDDLHCSFDKVSRCIELGIDVLVDDSPASLARALDAGLVAATIIHPWNEELVAAHPTTDRSRAEGVIGGRDWHELARRLEPVLERL